MYLFYIRVIRKLTDKKLLMKIAGKDSKLNKNIFVIFNSYNEWFIIYRKIKLD